MFSGFHKSAAQCVEFVEFQERGAAGDEQAILLLKRPTLSISWHK